VVTFAISAGVRIKFGILGCELVRKTLRAVAVIPGVFANHAELAIYPGDAHVLCFSRMIYRIRKQPEWMRS
jgi:hypothetical protein